MKVHLCFPPDFFSRSFDPADLLLVWLSHVEVYLTLESTLSKISGLNPSVLLDFCFRGHRCGYGVACFL